MPRTLVLGAGFGGLAVATELRQRVGDEHEILLIDRAERFAMGLRKLWALVGIGSYEEGSRRRELLDRRGVRFLRRRIDRIDAAALRVTSGEESFAGDHLVVALGAEPRPDLVPGLAEHAHDAWDAAAVPGLAAALAEFTGGHLALVIAGVPYTCPPAPYECAMLLDDHLRQRGVRDRTRISVTTLQPMLLPNAGKEGSAWMAERLAERGIEFHVRRKTVRVEPGRVVFAEGEPLAADLVIGVPPHRVPAVVAESGLTGDDGWIEVDPPTLATAHAKVYAIGDVTRITLANGLPLPKAGLIAELEGTRVAAAIAADLAGEPPPPGFDGRGYCFIETGKSAAALVEGEFFATPEPRVAIRPPSARHAEDKHRFEAERLARWFGR